MILKISVIFLDTVLKSHIFLLILSFFFKQVAERAELLFSEVLNAISQIAVKGSRRRIGELEELLQREKAEFEVINFYVI